MPRADCAEQKAAITVYKAARVKGWAGGRSCGDCACAFGREVRVCAHGGGARAASVRARPRHGSVADGPRGPRGAPPRRAARARAQVRPAKEVTAKQLERILEDKDFVAVYWCKCGPALAPRQACADGARPNGLSSS
ncbi:hypothetical protein RR46_06540 [Papilio xuthus]|uniref:Uncharacterized protein n=1 Tax=Papilio xuthus TaxID=66420 RepID=A0A194QD87_PAPXU|nr:hypothetical protein RR46_06540 [Papilio xuthus]